MEEYISWYDAKSVPSNCDNDYISCSGEVRYVTDPFNYEMNGNVVNKNLCEECYKNSIADI